MALVTRDTGASMDATTGSVAPQITGLIAGEDIDVVAACYIKTSDAKAYMSNGTAANEAAEFVGFSARAAKAGQPVTVFSLGARFRYGTALGAGDRYFVAATAGRLDTAATTGGLRVIAMAINSTDIVCIKATDAV